MKTNTKILFSGLIRQLGVDCVCDVGSRDGDQSLLFRQLLPGATVLAFEANPLNFAAMNARAELGAAKIRILPYAMTDQAGTAKFLVTDVDYANPAENRGTSSLFAHPELKVREAVEVPARRLDVVVPAEAPGAKRVALWIDVEGAEYQVCRGLEGIRDRVVALHVETARRPMREGQRSYAELSRLLADWGFTPRGSNLGPADTWGDVVFVSRHAATGLGVRLRWSQLRGLAGHWLAADSVAVTLKTRCPGLYRLLRRAYLRVST